MSDILDLEDGTLVEVVVKRGLLSKKELKFVGYFDKSISEYIVNRIFGWDFFLWQVSNKTDGHAFKLKEIVSWHELDYAGDLDEV